MARTSLSNSSENSSRSGYSPQFDDDTQYELRPKNSNQSNLAKRDSDQSIPSDGTDSRKNHNAFEFTDTKRGSLDVSSDLFDVGTDSKGKGASADSAQPPTAAPNYTTAAPAPDYEDAQLLHFASPRTSLPSEFTTTDDNEFGQYDDMDRLRKDAMRDLIGSATDDSESDSEVDTQGTLDEQHTGTSTRPLDTSLEKSSDFFEEEDTVSTAASDGSTWAALGEPRASNVDTPTGSLTAHSAGALGNGRPRAESLRPARVPSRRTSKPTIGYSQSVQGRKGCSSSSSSQPTTLRHETRQSNATRARPSDHGVVW
ncbi:hypothetical protein, variant [Sphaeroforma arctica JP610]|uniref:Uncharacterized protein n=1 Tax=Sphaeroforma arctica JP610 TaxID=667725 RepID=A0A0L0FKL7_9EUKA|nr:hypothetical protein, variant [Sphaeroforma arctica JP610]KNC77011.1 hypothetical protein, variant [Sphaeroforma arctica JP610]|eukprot:XP_014150913.1 hypothetical protein, variant [Sphaeroforma arctica JP610]